MAYHFRTMPLETLALLHRIEQDATAAINRTIVSARENGATWQEIGDALGITRQAAQQRYRNNIK